MHAALENEVRRQGVEIELIASENIMSRGVRDALGQEISRSAELEKALQSAVFPGVQGSLHSNVLAAKAVCLGEALSPEFKDYGQRVVENAGALAGTLAGHGCGIVAGGTDTHMVLLDLRPIGLTGQTVQNALARARITSNANPVPFDARRPSEWTGLRLGVSAVTTRGPGTEEMAALGTCIAEFVLGEAGRRSDQAFAHAKSRIEVLIRRCAK